MFSIGCMLNCLNGGYCYENVQQSAPHSLVTTNDRSFEEKDQHVCVCPYGWAGGSCGDSSSDLHPCYPTGDIHLCRTSGEACFQDDANNKWICVCDISDSVNAFAGSMCRAPATEFCDESKMSFCTNGGTCRRNIFNLNGIEGSGECVCPPEFDGPHCEFLSILFRKNPNLHEIYPVTGSSMTTSKDESESPTFIILSGWMMVMVLLSLALWRKKRLYHVSRATSNDLASSSLSRFHEINTRPNLLDSIITDDVNNDGPYLYDISLS